MEHTTLLQKAAEQSWKNRNFPSDDLRESKDLTDHRVCSVLSKTDVEKLEKKYLCTAADIVANNSDFVKERFSQQFKTYRSWKDKIKREKKRTTEMGIGAERIMHYVIARQCGEDFLPMSTPVGSDLFYETADAYIHIDLKTIYVENALDYLGLVVVGDAQTSYPMRNKWGAQNRFLPKLPQYYKLERNKVKPCLTYALQIIHVAIDDIIERKLDRSVIAILISSIPNGKLYGVYGEDICGEPKSFSYEGKVKENPANFRFLFYRRPYFEALKTEEKVHRIRIFFNRNYLGKTFDVQTSKYQRGVRTKISPEFITKMRKAKLKTVLKYV
jgi:hypothetical protein